MSERRGAPTVIVPYTDEAKRRARGIVASGGVIGFRTDTFYGLGCDPFNLEGVTLINRLKEREGRKPVLIVISDNEVAGRFTAERTGLFDELTKHYWPGPLTCVCMAREEVPEGITAGSGTIGIRLPFDEEVRELVRACGGALTATSANLAGMPPSRNAMEVASYFPDELNLIIDGGEARTDKPSTVIDVTHERPRLIREGEIRRTDLERTLHALGVKLE